MAISYPFRLEILSGNFRPSCWTSADLDAGTQTSVVPVWYRECCPSLQMFWPRGVAATGERRAAYRHESAMGAPCCLFDRSGIPDLLSLCRGSSGQVVLCIDVHTGEHVAVKLVLRGPNFSHQSISRELFNQGLCTGHPHIVQILVSQPRWLAGRQNSTHLRCILGHQRLTARSVPGD